MGTIPRGSDGRRLFTAEFKREQIDRIIRGEITVAELSRELGISRSLVQRWKHLALKGGRDGRERQRGGGARAGAASGAGTRSFARPRR